MLSDSKLLLELAESKPGGRMSPLNEDRKRANERLAPDGQNMTDQSSPDRSHCYAIAEISQAISNSTSFHLISQSINQSSVPSSKKYLDLLDARAMPHSDLQSFLARSSTAGVNGFLFVTLRLYSVLYRACRRLSAVASDPSPVVLVGARRAID